MEKNKLKFNSMFPVVIRICLILFFAFFIEIIPANAQLRLNSSSTISIFAASGVRTRVRYFWDLNEDCTVKRGFNIRLDRLPKHGRVELEKTQQLITESWYKQASSKRDISIARKCINFKVTVISAYYTSNIGYYGFDDFFLIRTGSNQKWESHREFKISVK